MKLIIGTAQFSGNYGINSVKKKISFYDKKNLLRCASKSKIKDLDTAVSYKKVHRDLGRVGVNKFKINTKLPKIKTYNINYEKWINGNIAKTLAELKLKKIESILIHNQKDLNIKNREKYILGLKKIKQKKLVKKIGISLYNIKDIFRILKFWKPDIIQIPYNIFDRRIEEKNILFFLKKRGIEIHARSVFLQGLLANKRRPKKFNKWSKYFDKWFDWCENNSIEPFKAAYLFANANKKIDKIIVGFENISQLKKLVNIKNDKKIKFPKINISDRTLLNPFNWKKI